MIHMCATFILEPELEHQPPKGGQCEKGAVRDALMHHTVQVGTDHSLGLRENP